MYIRYISETTVTIIGATNMPKWWVSQKRRVSLWKLVAAPITFHGMRRPHLPYGYGLIDPLSDPGVFVHGKLDTLPNDGVVGLCHIVCDRRHSTDDGDRRL